MELPAVKLILGEVETPLTMQEVSDLLGWVIERGPLSGLSVRHVQKPLADMVICRQGPNPDCELGGSGGYADSPRPDLIDHSAHLGRRLPTPLSPVSAGLVAFRYAAPADTGSLKSSPFVIIAQSWR